MTSKLKPDDKFSVFDLNIILDDARKKLIVAIDEVRKDLDIDLASTDDLQERIDTLKLADGGLDIFDSLVKNIKDDLEKLNDKQG